MLNILQRGILFYIIMWLENYHSFRLRLWFYNSTSREEHAREVKSMVNETRSTRTNPPKKFGRSKTLSGSQRPKPTKEGGLHVMSSSPRETRHERELDILSLVHDYAPKIPSFCRPLTQIIVPPLKVTHSTQTPEHGSRASSPGRGHSISEHDFNLHETAASRELLKRPSSSISPMRYVFLWFNQS